MAIEGDSTWVLEKLRSDPPEEVLKFVIWLLWDTKPQHLPADQSARYWRHVLSQRSDASTESLVKALDEFDDFLDIADQPAASDSDQHRGQVSPSG